MNFKFLSITALLLLSQQVFYASNNSSHRIFLKKYDSKPPVFADDRSIDKSSSSQRSNSCSSEQEIATTTAIVLEGFIRPAFDPEHRWFVIEDCRSSAWGVDENKLCLPPKAKQRLRASAPEFYPDGYVHPKNRK